MNKKISLAVIASSVLLAGNLSAQSLSEALTSGKVSGDVSLRYESRDFDTEVGTYYQNTAYLVPSIGLNYDSAAYNGFSFSAGFRAYATLWEDDEDSITTYGRGDAEDRIGDTDGNDQISKLYVQYQNDGLTVQVGRKDLPWGTKDWLSKINDGVFVNYENGDLFLEALYTQRRGRVYAHELFPMNNMKSRGYDDGLYHVAATYTINENYKVKGYFIEANDVHTTVGGKLYVNHKIGDVSINSMLHTVRASEDTLAEDTEVTEITLGGSYSGYSLTLGYVQNDEDNGLGSLWHWGDIVVPFEEGDTMYYSDATTYYAMLSKTISGVSLTALYGETEYGANNYDSSEFDIWASYGFTDSTSLSLSYALTNEDNADASISDMQQVGLTLSYSF